MNRLGIHFANQQWDKPSEDSFRLLAMCKPSLIKTCLHNQCGYTQIDVYRRLRAEHPDAKIIARLMGNGFDFNEYYGLVHYLFNIERLVNAFEIGNEPNHPVEWDKGLNEWLGWFHGFLTEWRGDRLLGKVPVVFPGMAVRYDIPGASPQEWYSRCRDAMVRCDLIGVHCYWQGDDNIYSEQWGQLYRYVYGLIRKDIVVTEVGDSTKHRSSVEKATRYVKWASMLPKYIIGSAAFILGGTEDWKEQGFDIDETACKVIGHG